MTPGRMRESPEPSPSLSAQAMERFDAIVLPHLDAAYNLARYLVRDPQDAEDVVQEACLRAIRHFSGFRGGDGRAWLLAIVRNACFTQLRRRRAGGERVEFDEELHGDAGEGSGPEADLVRTLEARSVDEALSQLPAEFREVVVLRELEELSYKEIAGIVGVPIGTVMSRLARARQRLSRVLRPQAVEGD